MTYKRNIRSEPDMEIFDAIAGGLFNVPGYEHAFKKVSPKIKMAAERLQA